MSGRDLRDKVLGGVEHYSRKYLYDVLNSLVEIPTVSAWGGADMARGAGLVASLLKETGFNVEVKSEGGHPAVLAEMGEGSRSILIYNHYDVQPPDPLELWDSDPFKLRVVGGKVYGRGVADNKGNIAARLAALEALSPYIEDLDIKVKVIVEGEEEIGSPTLERIVAGNLEWFKADGGIWETAYVRRDGRLSISLGFKGMVYVELTLRGASRDVHSGYSPIVPNPAWRMARMLTIIKDESGRVLVPGFYDDIDVEFLKMGESLLELVDVEDLEALREELGLKGFVGDLKGYEALKALHLNPSINISGLYSGYTGKGSKTIVPSTASAKLDIRLVPGQDPNKILEKLLEHLKANNFEDMEIHVESMYRAGYTKPGAAIVKASTEAAKEAYNKEPHILPMAAGSGPIYIFTNIAKTPMTGAGVGYYGSKVHAPNENIRIEDFHKGVKHVALTIINFATTPLTRKA
ncbi:MAG: M20/M25/M40 family metallo-hydrolase [Thermoprotei archaeon]|nr:M20/M25/M40 family metallo-hydrolase [Thermoprotei archaeon]